MYASQVVDDNPSQLTAMVAHGVMVKVLSGNMNQDVFDLIGSTYLGKTDYPWVGADKYPVVPLRVVAATTGNGVLGVTLNQTLQNDENGEKLLYNPVKKDELQAVLSGQAVPVATRGLFTFDQTAYDTDGSVIPGNIAVISPSTPGTLSGVTRESLADLTSTIVGAILGTGNRTSQMGKSDEFAGTGTAQYALIQLDCSASWDVA